MSKICPECGSEYSNHLTRCPVEQSLLAVDRTGAVIADRYQLEQLIGVGGTSSAVWKASQRGMGRHVAVKLVPPDEKMTVDRLARGARIASGLAHPHITTVHDYGQTPDDHLFLVMELLSGEPLTKVIERDAPFTPDRAVHIAGQVLRALEVAHSHQVVHRDLKPDNLLIISRDDDDNYVKVLDFGIAKLMEDFTREEEEALEAGITQGWQLCGTPLYMAPEQITGDLVDQRADLYAIGVVVYEMLTGRVPFDGRTRFEVIGRHLSETPVTPSELVPDHPIPAGLERVVMRSLSKNADDRYQTAREFRHALQVALHDAVAPSGDTNETGPFVGPTSSGVFDPRFTVSGNGPAVAPAEASTPRRRRGAFYAVAAALFVALVGGILFVTLGDQGRPPGATTSDGVAAVAVDGPATPSAVVGKTARQERTASRDETAVGPRAGEAPPEAVAVAGAQTGSALAEVAAEPPLAAARAGDAAAAAGDARGVAPEPEPARPSTFPVRIESTPEGASVYRGSTLLGATPLSTELPPGVHALKLELQGHRNKYVEVGVNSDQGDEPVVERVTLLADAPTEPAPKADAPRPRAKGKARSRTAKRASKAKTNAGAQAPAKDKPAIGILGAPKGDSPKVPILGE